MVLLSRLRAALAAVVLSLAGGAAPSATHEANTGAPGSPCRAVVAQGQSPGRLDTTALGPRAPAPYELGLPPSGRTARVMVLLHGGGWYGVGRGMLDDERRAAADWRAAGWTTLNADYRACGAAVDSVVATYDLLRAHVGARVPVCVQGESAGGHLALLLAARRPDVACVLAYGAPADLVDVAAQGMAAAFGGTGVPELAAGGAYVRGLAEAAFGSRALTTADPVRVAGDVRARVLLATAQDDPLVPLAQARSFAAAAPTAAGGAAAVDVLALAPGVERFVHGTASPAALGELRDRVARLVAPFGPPPRP